MTCHEAREQLSAWLDEALTAEERAQVDAHLAGCADCRRELERLRQTIALLHAVEPARAPAGFADRVLAASGSPPWHRRILRRLAVPLPAQVPLAAAAALLVAIAAVYLVGRTPDLQTAARPQASYPLGRDVPATSAPTTAARPAPTAPPAARKEPPPEPSQEQAPAKREADQPPAAAAPLGKDAKVADPASPPSPPGAKAAEAPAAAPRADAGSLGRASELEARQEARPEAKAETAERAKSAPGPSVHRFSARALVSVDVVGRLAVSDREAAARALAGLVARLEGQQLARRPDPGTPGAELVEILIPRAAYAEFTAGLARLGRWIPEREALESPEHVRVVVRLTD